MPNKDVYKRQVPDGVYYEVTHNGDKNETYVEDVYKRQAYRAPGNPAQQTTK